MGAHGPAPKARPAALGCLKLSLVLSHSLYQRAGMWRV
ncbi:hypothetical protein Z945_2304 [Sulfitobacter noctilucae]|nr:hypothetical protein Z945_2304 [Sulfitobacter noctilucae]